ncbi:MAG: ATP-binding cassette domain-containing protein, partial [Actinomycetales bacterium]
MIKFENVTKVYSKADRPALDNISLEVEKGEFVFLVGLSGSGKSTFLRLVLREEKPTSGKIHVAGKDLTTLSNWTTCTGWRRSTRGATCCPARAAAARACCAPGRARSGA